MASIITVTEQTRITSINTIPLNPNDTNATSDPATAATATILLQAHSKPSGTAARFGGISDSAILHSPCCQANIKARCQSCNKGCIRCDKGKYLIHIILIHSHCTNIDVILMYFRLLCS